MSIYLVLKVIHILAAITALGANLTYPFWLRRAGNDRDRVLDTLDGIRALDRRIANPAYIVVFVVGVFLVLTGNLSFTTFWIGAAIVLFIVIAVLGATVYGPALRRQEAEARADITSPAYAAAARRQNVLGLVVTLLVVVIVGLMVFKPTL
ncbi:MAG TPA: DUF2269 family protein [Candidatus Limnocylindrales bacterium]|nr:DUF2269 family protein [Candidatus Limnocylindrales bacterium]